jgi:hypothetical protein
LIAAAPNAVTPELIGAGDTKRAPCAAARLSPGGW